MSRRGETHILRRMKTRHALLLSMLIPVAAFGQNVGDLVTVPALTPVIVRLEELLSSNKSKPGDKFRITVAEDVRVGNVIVIPAGSVGQGEVIHAAKTGAGGKAGELIVAARYVQLGDNNIRLRSFVVGVTGKDQTETSLAVGVAVGVFGMFVHGGVVTVPVGTLGTAKTATEFKLPAVAVQTPPAVSQPAGQAAEEPVVEAVAVKGEER